MSIFDFFGSSRNNKDKWAAIVMAGTKSGMDIDEKTLIMATTLYIQQRMRILYESIHLVLISGNPETREGRYRLAQKHIAALIKVKEYADKEQRKSIDQAVDDFIKMEDQYKHPERELYRGRMAAKKKRREEFWETYAEMEMMDIFSGKDE